MSPMTVRFSDSPFRSAAPVGSVQSVQVLSTTVLDPGSASTPVRINTVGWYTGLEIVPAA